MSHTPIEHRFSRNGAYKIGTYVNLYFVVQIIIVSKFIYGNNTNSITNIFISKIKSWEEKALICCKRLIKGTVQRYHMWATPIGHQLHFNLVYSPSEPQKLMINTAFSVKL